MDSVNVTVLGHVVSGLFATPGTAFDLFVFMVIQMELLVAMVIVGAAWYFVVQWAIGMSLGLDELTPPEARNLLKGMLLGPICLLALSWGSPWWVLLYGTVVGFLLAHVAFELAGVWLGVDLPFKSVAAMQAEERIILGQVVIWMAEQYFQLRVRIRLLLEQITGRFL